MLACLISTLSMMLSIGAESQKPKPNAPTQAAFDINYTCLPPMIDDSKTEKWTIDGPETMGLVDQISGVVIVPDGRDFEALALPSMRKLRVRTAPMDDETTAVHAIHAISGPDSEGRIAYLEDEWHDKNLIAEHYSLKTINLDGTNATELFSRPGSFFWTKKTGSYIALAPKGGHVAILGATQGKHASTSYVSVGNIEIWNIITKSSFTIKVNAINEPMSWFPDGKRLAYVRLISKFISSDKISSRSIGIKDLHNYLHLYWDEVPAIYVLNIETGVSTFFREGWQPIVSSDGKHMIVKEWSSLNKKWDFMRVNVSDRRSELVECPGDCGGPVALIGERLVLYVGLPTTGATNKANPNDQDREASFKLTLKAGEFKTNRFQTLIYDIWPQYYLISFGQPLNWPKPIPK